MYVLHQRCGRGGGGDRGGGGQWDGKQLVSHKHTHTKMQTLFNPCLQTHFWVARSLCYLPQTADS